MANEVATAEPKVEAPKAIVPAKPVDPEALRADRMDKVIRESYEKISNLKIKQVESDILGREFLDTQVEILVTGELYIPHMVIRERLTEAFGRGQWGMISTDQKYENGNVYVKWLLLVRGVRVGETWAGHFYQGENQRVDLGDAFDSTEGIAIRRIAAKSSLSCGSQVWRPDYIRRWVAENAVQVWRRSTTGKGKPPHWRRKDVAPFYDETGLVKSPQTPTPQEKREPEQSEPTDAEAAREAGDWAGFLAQNPTIDRLNEMLPEIARLPVKMKSTVKRLIARYAVQNGWKIEGSKYVVPKDEIQEAEEAWAQQRQQETPGGES
jgi:hypothetical protein